MLKGKSMSSLFLEFRCRSGGKINCRKLWNAMTVVLIAPTYHLFEHAEGPHCTEVSLSWLWEQPTDSGGKSSKVWTLCGVSQMSPYLQSVFSRSEVYGLSSWLSPLSKDNAQFYSGPVCERKHKAERSRKEMSSGKHPGKFLGCSLCVEMWACGYFPFFLHYALVSSQDHAFWKPTKLASPVPTMASSVRPTLTSWPRLRTRRGSRETWRI